MVSDVGIPFSSGNEALFKVNNELKNELES